LHKLICILRGKDKGNGIAIFINEDA